MHAKYLNDKFNSLAPATGKSRVTITHITFFLLFPGFFFYQTLLGLGKINSFLGGYFSIIIIILFFPTLFYYFKKIKLNYNIFLKIDLYFFIFIIYFLLIITINYYFGKNISTIANHIRSIFYFITLFITFKLINYDNLKFKIILILSIIAMSTIIFAYSVDGTFYLATQNLSKNSEDVANYQAFARSYLITIIVVLGFIKSIIFRTFIYCLAAPTLYINGARSEFLALLGLLPIIEIYRSKYSLNPLIFLVLLSAIVAFNFENIISFLPSNRMLELLDLSQSTSANARHYLNAQALNTILSNPILGDYGSYAPGDYAHNILSAWVDLGLFGFGLLLILLISPILLLISEGFRIETKSNNFMVAFCLLSVTIFLLFTSHNFTDMTTGAALGAFTNYWSGRKK